MTAQPDEYRQRIRDLVDAAPPITEQQRQELRPLLQQDQDALNARMFAAPGRDFGQEVA